MRFKKKERGKKIKYWLLGIVAAAVIVPALWVLVTRMEGKSPDLDLQLDTEYIGSQTEISGSITDEKSGVRKFWAAVVQDGKEIVLEDTTYEKSGENQSQVSFSLPFNIEKLGLSDGKALLRIAAWDRSWRNWISGNRTYFEKEIIIDTRAPKISVLSRQHNINQGGSGLVIYRLSEPCRSSGIQIGDEFFQGYNGYFEDTDIYLALFALGYDQDADTSIQVRAVDSAGNTGKGGLYYHIRERKFHSESLNISDRFLNRILPNFQSHKDIKPDEPTLKQFLAINNKLRTENNKTIVSHGRQSDNEIYWSGRFLRLPGSAHRASFADHRAYLYNGDIVDRQVHLGIDLASTQHAPVPAANTGRVAYAEPNGIYGNTVIIDHGFGLFSVYAHLSRMNVNTDDMISRGDIIGYSGTTGLAGGDHLHYGMFVNHVFVDPVEWWDEAWIQNNIAAKIEAAQTQ